MKITNHFSVEEFTKRDPKMLTPIQTLMLQNICNNLEIIRAFLRNVPIKISDGLRLPSDINRLRKSGYNPSETSDHLFGNIVKLRSKVKTKLYGKYYVYSVGACDFVPSCGAQEAFNLMKTYFTRQTGIISLPDRHIKVGQMILEKRDSFWIHMSNPPDLIYSDQIVASFFNRKHFLQSLNNGKSYETV